MKKIIGATLAFIVGFILLIAAVNSVYSVKSGQRGIVFEFGKIQAVTSEGLNFKIPFIQSVERVDIRTQKASAPCDAGTKDLQTVSSEVAINYHLDPMKLKEMYLQVGLDVEGKIIDPRIQEVVKATVARYSAEQLLSQREAVKSDIVKAIKSSVGTYNIIVEDVQITNFKFSSAFNEAIEAKQTAEQNALKAENDLKRIKIEAEQRIATAKAEAEAIRIQTEAIREQGGSAYVALKTVEKWDGVLPTMTGGSVPFINVK